MTATYVDELVAGMTWPDIRAARHAAVLDSWMERGLCAAPRTASWADDAACHGCRDFTLDLCDTCPSRTACLIDAVTTERLDLESVHGIRGGIPADHRAAWYRLNLPTVHHPDRPIEHDTDAGYRRCVQRPEGACDPCKAAHARDERHRRAARRARRAAAAPTARLTIRGAP